MFACRLLPCNVHAVADFSLAGIQSTNSSEAGMLGSIIVRNWTLFIAYVTYIYRNTFAINSIM